MKKFIDKNYLVRTFLSIRRNSVAEPLPYSELHAITAKEFLENAKSR